MNKNEIPPGLRVRGAILEAHELAVDAAGQESDALQEKATRWLKGIRNRREFNQLGVGAAVAGVVLSGADPELFLPNLKNERPLNNDDFKKRTTAYFGEAGINLQPEGAIHMNLEPWNDGTEENNRRKEFLIKGGLKAIELLVVGHKDNVEHEPDYDGHNPFRTGLRVFDVGVDARLETGGYTDLYQDDGGKVYRAQIMIGKNTDPQLVAIVMANEMYHTMIDSSVLSEKISYGIALEEALSNIVSSAVLFQRQIGEPSTSFNADWGMVEADRKRQRLGKWRSYDGDKQAIANLLPVLTDSHNTVMFKEHVAAQVSYRVAWNQAVPVGELIPAVLSYLTERNNPGFTASTRHVFDSIAALQDAGDLPPGDGDAVDDGYYSISSVDSHPPIEEERVIDGALKKGPVIEEISVSLTTNPVGWRDIKRFPHSGFIIDGKFTYTDTHGNTADSYFSQRFVQGSDVFGSLWVESPPALHVTEEAADIQYSFVNTEVDPQATGNRTVRIVRSTDPVETAEAQDIVTRAGGSVMGDDRADALKKVIEAVQRPYEIPQFLTRPVTYRKTDGTQVWRIPPWLQDVHVKADGPSSSDL